MDAIATRNDLDSNAKKASIALLNARLAEAIDLALLTKQAHWNVKGPQFIAIHEMLDEFRTEVDGQVDTIAERAVQLGGTAEGTSQAIVKATPLKPYPTDISKTKDHLARRSWRDPRLTKATRRATPTPRTSSPPTRARSTSCCGSWRRTRRRRSEHRTEKCEAVFGQSGAETNR